MWAWLKMFLWKPKMSKDCLHEMLRKSLRWSRCGRNTADIATVWSRFGLLVSHHKRSCRNQSAKPKTAKHFLQCDDTLLYIVGDLLMVILHYFLTFYRPNIGLDKVTQQMKFVLVGAQASVQWRIGLEIISKIWSGLKRIFVIWTDADVNSRIR